MNKFNSIYFGSDNVLSVHIAIANEADNAKAMFHSAVVKLRFWFKTYFHISNIFYVHCLPIFSSEYPHYLSLPRLRQKKKSAEKKRMSSTQNKKGQISGYVKHILRKTPQISGVL